MKCLKCNCDLLLANEKSYYDYNIEDKDGYVQNYWCDNELCELEEIFLYIKEDATL
tara:strand:- start:419 stop:586 length:168 start_codon:yes stop_codon:yes gene_type:complete